MRRITASLAGIVAGLLMAGPALAADPGAAGMLIGFQRGGLAESFVPEDISAGLSSIDRFQLRCHLTVTERDRLWLRVSRAAYRLDDLDFPGTTHQRNETQLSLADLWVYRAGILELAIGPGYRAAAIEASSNYEMPDKQAGLFFENWSVLHGPSLMGQLRLPLPLGAGLRVEAEWIPYAFMALADPRVAFPAVTSVWSSAALTFWDDRLHVGYFYDRTLGGGFDREAQGWLASLSVSGQ